MANASEVVTLTRLTPPRWAAMGTQVSTGPGRVNFPMDGRAQAYLVGRVTNGVGRGLLEACAIEH